MLSLWQYNRDYIVEFLCENTERPELQCDGKCFLKNELEKQNDTEKQAQQALSKKFEVTAFVFPNLKKSFFVEKIFIQKEIITNFFYFFYFPNNSKFGIFHPPQKIKCLKFKV